MTIRNITEFFPPGTQMASPGGVSFDLDAVVAVEVVGNPPEQELRIYLGNNIIRATFYRNEKGEPADAYAIQQAIETAIKADAMMGSL